MLTKKVVNSSKLNLLECLEAQPAWISLDKVKTILSSSASYLKSPFSLVWESLAANLARFSMSTVFKRPTAKSLGLD